MYFLIKILLSFVINDATAHSNMHSQYQHKEITQFMTPKELSCRLYLLGCSHSNVQGIQVEVKTCARRIHYSSLHWFQSEADNSNQRRKPGASLSLPLLLDIHHSSRGATEFHTGLLVYMRWTTESQQLPWTCTSRWSRGRHHRSFCWTCSLQSDQHLWGSHKSDTRTKL